MSTVITRRPPMNPSRRLPAGAPIWPDRMTASARPLPATNNPAVEPATPLRKLLRFGTCSPSLLGVAALLENKLGAEFEQAPAHDLYRVHELVIRVAVARLLVEDGAPVEDVIEVEIPLQLGLPYRESPAETEIQLLDPIVEDRGGRNQRDRAVGGTCSGSLIALRQVPAERRLDFSVGSHVGRRDREPRFVLVDRAGLEVPGQGVDDIETERRPAGPWRADVAERGRSRRHD